MIHPQGRPPRRYLVRHGETEWSLAGRHTGRTDLALTAEGVRQAARLLPYFRRIAPSCILTSPLERARQTCRGAGLADPSSVDTDLAEWDYGDYEGRTTADIQRDHPGWDVFRDGCPAGETAADVEARADRVIVRLRVIDAETALFSHGQFGCALAARWIGLPIAEGRHLAFDAAAISILSDKPGRDNTSQIMCWNLAPGDCPQ